MDPRMDFEFWHFFHTLASVKSTNLFKVHGMANISYFQTDFKNKDQGQAQWFDIAVIAVTFY